MIFATHFRIALTKIGERSKPVLASVVIAKWEGAFGTDPEPLPDQEG